MNSNALIEWLKVKLDDVLKRETIRKQLHHSELESSLHKIESKTIVQLEPRLVF